MAMPTSEEQFLPRLLAVFYAVFHPTEGPKVIYQVPEGSITEEKTTGKADAATSSAAATASANANATSSSTKAQPNKGVGVLGGEPLFDFSALSEYLIPKAPLCGRLVTSIARGTVGVRQRHHERHSRAPSVVPGRSGSARSGGSSRASSIRPRGPEDADASGKLQLEQRTYKIMGFPTLIEDASKYQRNNFIFNLCFVFEGQSDVRAYEPVVRKCGRVLRGLEETQSFLSSPKSLPRMNEVIEQLFEDLSSYSESFVALPEAPHTSYLKSSSKPTSPEGQNLASPPIGPDDYISLGASFASLRGEHHRNMINERLKQKQMQQASNGGGGLRSRSASGSASPHFETGKSLTPLTTIRNDALPMVKSNSASGTSGPGSEGPSSPASVLSPTGSNGRRPSMARSSTIVGLTDDAGQGAFPSEESRDNAMGIVTSRKQSELSRELSAAESLGNVLTNIDSNAYDSINTASGTRRSSRGSTVGPHEANSLEHLAESIVSLRTIDAALFDSANALRAETADKRTALVEKREPPHGLGRTVRDAINLKLFPVYPNPTPINDWDVPVALLDLVSRVDGNWDLTLRRILPFIDGVNHVKRIAQLADADLGLTRACLEHLVYYGCLGVVDIFQYFNMYTLRPVIAKLAGDEALGLECATYVTRPGYAYPSYPEILRLYSLLRAGTTLHDWVEDNDVDAKGIDVRRFVSFGVIQGFLRRVHRYPIYLGPRTGEDGFVAFDASVVSTVRNSPVVSSPVVKSNDSNLRRSEGQEAHRRDQSGSREPRDRRPRELSGMSGAYSAFQRIGRDGSVESPGVGHRNALRERASEARLSNIVLGAGGGSASAFNLGDSFHTASAGGSSQFGTSPTKRHARMRQRNNARFPTTTAVDVASVAFQAERPAGSGAGSGTARSPRKRASVIGLSTAIPSTAAAAGASGAGSGFGGASGSHTHPRSGTATIPAELVDMLDGLHSDDEICVAFSISWPELEKMLVQIGRSAHARADHVDTDDDD
ncbi:related to NPR2-nitrogen permease regulator, partial [Sporisorium reilianum f. sp. reilianum]